MALRVRVKVLLHVWSHDFYDMTLSTELQRRHMINVVVSLLINAMTLRFRLCFNVRVYMSTESTLVCTPFWL